MKLPFPSANASPRRAPRAVLAGLLAAFALLGGGCGESSTPLQEISTQEIVGNVPGVFDGAPAEVRQLAADVVAAIEQQDFTTAWDKLQVLGGREGLTDAQKEFVAESLASVGAEVQKAEEAGNEAAQQALQFHRANK